MGEPSIMHEPAASPEAASRPLLVATDVGRRGGIPYVAQFYDALAGHEVVLLDEPLGLSKGWLDRNAGRVDVIHLQWPDWIWEVKLKRLHDSLPWLFRLPVVPRALRTMGSLVVLRRLLSQLDRARASGMKIVRTVHNLESHEGDRWIDRLGKRRVDRMADLIICHDQASKETYRGRKDIRGEIVVMGHGNYDGVYPPPRPRSEVLKELGLNEDMPIVSCIGGLRDYKGFDIACRAVALMGGKVQLLIAGNPHPQFDLAELETLARDTPGVALVARRLKDSEFADFCHASDVILLPYRKITTSGLLLAALTASRAVVASDLPYLREVIEMEPGAGVLVKPGDPRALAEGIEKLLAVPGEDRNRAARALADKFDWGQTVAPVAEVLERWRAEKIAASDARSAYTTASAESVPSHS